MISHIAAAFLLLAACAIHGTEQKDRSCSRLIHDVHLNRLLDLVDSQMMKPSCELSFEYVDERKLDDPKCFLRAAYSPLRNILESIEFKRNTPNSNTMKDVKDWHLEVGDCMDINSSDEEESKHCTKPFSQTARQMLKLVHEYFSKAKEILSEGNFSHDCSSVFEKCSDSEGKSATSPGVVTDQDCPCPATSPMSGRGSASLLPTFEPSSSIADRLDSKEAAASTFQLFMQPGTMQTQGGSQGSTRPRMPRSTQRGQAAAEPTDFVASTEAVMSSPPEELALAALSTNIASFLDSAVTLDSWSPRLKNISPPPSSQQSIAPMGTGSPLPGSVAGSSQTWPHEFPSHSSPFSGSTKPSLRKQWLRSTEMDVSGWAVTDTGSTSGLTLASLAGLDSAESSGVPSSGSGATLSPRDPPLFPVSEDPLSAAQQLSRLAVTTNSPSSHRQVPPESYSWGAEGSRGRAPGVLHSTQLRERRAEQEEGPAKGREPEDSMAGPSSDLSFIPPNTDKHSEKPEARDTQGMAVTYVVVPSVLGILLAVGGLLFYFHKSRMLARRRLQRNERNLERQEGRPLNRGEGDLELQIQEEEL
ncbi:macrophage colony-stimulating factor 1 isoform X1 [Zootoca vivipara]|uniref:macrophage colony-stimulating factor 1 isoform X1 n=1 Tax=Zootoca vivipara TaxID=8524 RepID=UPI00293BA555|nr:macrophage colony-stimulating factor 1 isoform X1 [Zootoca vivipara]